MTSDLVLIKELGQLKDGHIEVRLIEAIRNVPTNGAKLDPFLNYGVEETQAE